MSIKMSDGRVERSMWEYLGSIDSTSPTAVCAYRLVVPGAGFFYLICTPQPRAEDGGWHHLQFVSTKSSWVNPLDLPGEEAK